MKKFDNVLVIGGGGYVGAVLIPKLLKEGYKVKVYDLFIYGEEVFNSVKNNPNLTLIKGDVRDIPKVEAAIKGSESIIHLACISNDPSVELNPNLAKSVNLDCFRPCVQSAKKNKVKRFVYASSSSVYGVKEEQNVTEEMSLEPLTDYSRFKAACEEILMEEVSDNDEMTTLILRPATVCGYSPRLRLDLTVNILTNHAVTNRKIKVFGGGQMRPNLNIQDMTDLYVKTLEFEASKIHKKVFNAGYENHSVADIAGLVKKVIGDDIAIVVEPTDDNRSYHVSSEKIKNELGFSPKYTITDAITSIKEAFDKKLIIDSMNNSFYYNIKRMKDINLQ
jgi:nucleoside-diphosphate-sugar epimerase